MKWSNNFRTIVNFKSKILLGQRLTETSNNLVAVAFFCFIQVAGQRLMYKFDKLPYKYVPGVTRSRYHGHRIKACIQTQLRRVDVAPSHINNSYLSSPFIPVNTAARKRCCCPLKPMPSRPIMWRPGPMPHAPPISYSHSRVMFPFAVDSVTTAVGFKPFHGEFVARKPCF